MENTTTPQSEGRREALKTLATVPALGAMAYGVYKKRQKEQYNKVAGNLFDVNPAPVAERKTVEGEVIRIGIIGYGSRGAYLMRSLGVPTPELLDDWKKK